MDPFDSPSHPGRLSFRIEAESPGTSARAARFHTAHGEILTPRFMPVGTQGAVRSQTWDQIREIGAPIVLANTYHLHLRPGIETLRALGGLHRMTGWEGAILTDSGGFQIFSLPEERQMTEAAAVFRSRIDGRTVHLSPEASIETQVAIGSDLMMVLDQCITSTAPRIDARAAMELTHRWARRSLDARSAIEAREDRRVGALLGIVQGACFPDLRRESAEALTALPFDGYAIGGLAVGEQKHQREDITELTAELLPRERPRYLMGVGTPLDLLEGVHRGVDLFDCILPTQVAQRGTAYTGQGPRQLRRGAYRLADEPLDPECPCSTCRRYSRAYLHHLIKCQETLGWTLIAHHNLFFYARLMSQARERIFDGTFVAFLKQQRERLGKEDVDRPAQAPRIGRVAKSRRMELGAFRVIDSPDGHSSLQHLASGEVNHSVNDPREEARRLYVEQSRLVERLSNPGPELVVWDGGLGSAFNAMECILAVEAAHRTDPKRLRRGLRLVSFENDLDSLRLSLWHPERFAHLRHPAPTSLLTSGSWSSGAPLIRWELQEGDFRETLGRAPRPDLIFYDFYSSKGAPEMWSAEIFARIRQACLDGPTELFTYSVSTAARAALLLAGFYVGEGAGTGPKSATTIAATHDGLERALGAQWLGRWSRSGAPFPSDVEQSAWTSARARLLAHPQLEKHARSCGLGVT